MSSRRFLQESFDVFGRKQWWSIVTRQVRGLDLGGDGLEDRIKPSSRDREFDGSAGRVAGLGCSFFFLSLDVAKANPPHQ